MSTIGKLFLGGLGVACVLALACSEAPREGSAKAEARVAAELDGPRHVLLIVIDTLRADHLSCYGYWRETSPNIDGMARRGVRFERAIAQSSWTSPSMITLMTGQRLSRKRYRLPEDKPTLAELFKDAGYRTGAWVSNPLLNQKNGFQRGFERWVSDPLREIDGAVEWLHENADHDTFTWVHFTDPHDPYKPPREFRSKTPGRLSEAHEELMDAAAPLSEEQGDLDEQREFIAREVGLYDDEIVAVDRKVRELLAALQEEGNLDRAVVVLTSDHGECLWERRESDTLIAHQRKTRGTPTRLEHVLKQTHGEYVYQELVRVPLIVMAPGLPRNQIERRVAESVHLAPTILALAGVDVDGIPTMAGADLFGDDWLPGAYTMTNQGEAFVAEDGWKLILPTEEGIEPYGQVLQLYDLNSDPGERHNLAGEQPDRVAELTQLIHERRASALPLEKAGDWESQTRENAEALRALGYADAGLVDLGEEHDEHASEESEPTEPEDGL